MQVGICICIISYKVIINEPVFDEKQHNLTKGNRYNGI